MREDSNDNQIQEQKKRKHWLFLAPLLVCLFAFGPLKVRIVRPIHWTCTHKSRGSDVMMDFDRFTIIFKGVLRETIENKTWVSSGTESWQGNTYSRGNIITSDLFYTRTSSHGITHFVVAGHSFTIKDDGPTLVLASQVYDVSASRKVFIVDKSGKVKVQ